MRAAMCAADWFGQFGLLGDAADDPPGAVPLEPRPARGQEDGSLAAFADCEVDRAGGPRRERDQSPLAALAHDGQSAVTALDAERLDVRADRLGYPQAVQREQRYESVLGRAA